MSKTILLTGSEGFVGRTLQQYFSETHPDYKIITVDTVGSPDVKTNLMKPFLYEPTEKVDAIIHLAAMAGVRGANPYLDTNNVLACENMLRWATENKVELFVHSSSSSVYGLEPLQHEAQTNLQPISVYGKSKLKCEKLIQTWAATNGTGVNLRLFNVLGKGQRKDMFPYMIADHLYAHTPIKVLGNRYRNYTYAGDVARAFDDTLKFFNWPKKGVCFNLNVGSGVSLTQTELIKRYQDMTRREVRYEQVAEHADDVPVTRADTLLFQSVFGWKPTIDMLDVGIQEICEGVGLATYR